MKRFLVTASTLVAAAGAVSCSSGPPGSSSSGGSVLSVAAFSPFSGPDATFGPEMMAGCQTGVNAVNRAGGVLGHRLRCIPTDTRGDPADAVPAADKLIAANPGLIGVLGPTGDEADATTPIFEQAKLPMFVDTGESAYNHTALKYFWRLFPPDNAQGEAMSLWGRKQGSSRAAAVFGNDIGSQGNVGSMVSTFNKAGGTVVAKLSLALDKSSYRTEVERVIAAKPQVIMSEADPQTDATFLAELKQLHGLIPIIGTDVTKAFRQAVTLAIGQSSMVKYWTGVQPYAPSSGPAWQAYNSTLLASGAQIHNPSQWSDDTYSIRPYDAVITMALAMLAANSTSPSAYNKYIGVVTKARPGATVVYTYAQGKAALKAGKKIQFIGAGGPILFDRWHNSAGAFEAVRYTGNTNVVIGQVSSQEISKNG